MVGLAAAGRSRHQHDAVGVANDLAEAPQDGRVHADLLQVELHDCAVKHAHDHALAKHRGQHADAKVHRVAADVELDSAVLRQPPLGNVEFRHDLDTRGDCVGQMPRRRHHLVQHAVGTDADFELILEGLEVDVAGLILDRQQQHHVEQFADGCGRRDFLVRRQVEGGLLSSPLSSPASFS